MSAMDIDADSASVLANLRSHTENPDIMQVLYQMEDFYERKLWNQLSLAMDELLAIPESKNDHFREKIFDQFLSRFKTQLNSIKVVDFLLRSFEDPAACLQKLQALKTSFVTDLTNKLLSRRLTATEQAINDDEAMVYIRLQIARYSLLLNEVAGAEEILESMNEKFTTALQNEYSSKINAAYYLTKCQYCKIKENYNQFYTNGLLYLSSTDTPMTLDEQVSFCHDLCIAALLGDKIYNFGELILHSILGSISGPESPYHWLHNLIQHLNAGNLEKFTSGLRDAYGKSPQLEHHAEFLHQKIVIMALLELISLKPSNSKTLSFAEISEVTGAAADDVEFLIIKCFSLGLIKGYINQLEHVLIVNWLQPRILNRDQVKTLYNHLIEWDRTVEGLAKDVHANGGTVWAGV